VLAERLRQAGYRTAAFVSSFVLARRFGLARGFDVYDDTLPPASAERTAEETTARALALVAETSRQPLFLWVHYFDPHAPYTPPEPFRSRYAKAPYLGEVAAMDAQLGRLVQAVEQHVAGPLAIVIVGDHGEGLGDHGESQHGNLVYQSTMQVPLLLVGPGVGPGVSDAPVSTRRVFHTILDWAGLGATDSLRRTQPEVVLGEAMKPFLAYGWQPQVMAIEGQTKAILAGRLEAYDLVADPKETRDLGETASLPRPLRTALREYPAPSLDPPKATESLSEEERRKLASLGYVSAGAAPVVRKEAPRPADMARLFDVLEQASGLFVREEYARVIPLLERILAEDPYNLDAALRLATAHSSLGHEAQALSAFEKAGQIAPGSQDVRTYLALHYARGREWERAAPLLEDVVAKAPKRLPAVEALAVIRERQGRMEDALALRQRIYALRTPSPAELVQLGQFAMSLGRTPLALESFEKAREAQASRFAHDLELGVLYLAARRLAEARDALDRVSPSHSEYPMALFKRAQVSVLLKEPDQGARIEAARRHADPTTRPLIERERLFQRARTP
jgi:tetratricopeptide (TPR) repeat protein